MTALLSSAPLLLRRRGALADLLPVIAFAAASGILMTVLGGVGAFLARARGASDAAGAAGAGQSEEASILLFFLVCACIAATLLVPSALGLGGAAARLSLARRERDLAAMRLVGGTTAQVGLVAVADVVVQAVAGAMVGLGLHLAATPLMTTLDFGIDPFTARELLLPWWGYPLVLLWIVALAAGSAAVSLLGVAVTPLGVARQSRSVRMSIARVALWGALMLGFFIAARSTGQL